MMEEDQIGAVEYLKMHSALSQEIRTAWGAHERSPLTHGLFNHTLFAVYPLLMAELLPNYLPEPGP